MGGDGELISVMKVKVEGRESPEHRLPAAIEVGDEHANELEGGSGEPAGEPGGGGPGEVVERQVELLHARARHEAERRLEPVAHAVVAEEVVPRVVGVEQAHARRGLRSREVSAVRCQDRKSTRLNSSHVRISYAVFCLKKKKKKSYTNDRRTLTNLLL